MQRGYRITEEDLSHLPLQTAIAFTETNKKCMKHPPRGEDDAFSFTNPKDDFSHGRSCCILLFYFYFFYLVFHHVLPTIRVQFVFTFCMRDNMLRKVRDRKYMCLKKPLPEPDFRGLAVPIPRLFGIRLFIRLTLFRVDSLFLKIWELGKVLV